MQQSGGHNTIFLTALEAKHVKEMPLLQKFSGDCQNQGSIHSFTE